MIGNIIQSYLVSLGVQIDRPGFQQADQTIRETGANIERVTSGMARNFVKAQTIIASAIAGVTASALGLMRATANQDLAMQKYARSMLMSEDAAWRMKKATDALGESINDIALTPELLGRFTKLTADGSKMKVGGDFKATMKDFRDLIFEFTRLKQEASYALNWVGYYLMKYLQKPLADIREKFKTFNDAVIKGMSVWTEKVARGIYYVIEVGRHFLEFIVDVGKHLKNLWDSFPKGAKIAIAAITAINVALSAGPLGRSIMLISTLLLLIDDYYGYMEGKDAALGPYWDKLNEYLAQASQWYETLKKEAEPYWDMVVGYAEDAAKWIGEVVTSIKEWAETSGQGILDSFIEEIKEIGSILWGFVEVGAEVVSTISEIAGEHLKNSKTFETAKSIFTKIGEAIYWLWTQLKEGIKFIQQLVRELMKTEEMREYIKACMDLYDSLMEIFDVIMSLVGEAFRGLFGEISKTDLLYAFLSVLKLILSVVTKIQRYTKFWIDRLKDLFTLLKDNKVIQKFFEEVSKQIDKSLGRLGKFARALSAVLEGNPKKAWNILMEDDNKGKGRGRRGKPLTETEEKWEPEIQKAAKKYNIDPDMLRALIWKESGFDPYAESPMGALGIAQFMPATAASFGIDPMDPYQSIDAAAKYIRNELDHFGGSTEKALAAYNAGRGAVEEFGGIPPYKETQNYVKEIKARMEEYKKAGKDVEVSPYYLGTQIDREKLEKVSWFNKLEPWIGGMLNSVGAGDAVYSSGYRTEAQNRAANSAPNSYHVHGDAVDIVLPDGADTEAIKEMFEPYFEEVLYHNAGSGLHLHLGGYKGGGGELEKSPVKTALETASDVASTVGGVPGMIVDGVATAIEKMMPMSYKGLADGDYQAGALGLANGQYQLGDTAVMPNVTIPAYNPDDSRALIPMNEFIPQKDEASPFEGIMGVLKQVQGTIQDITNSNMDSVGGIFETFGKLKKAVEKMPELPIPDMDSVGGLLAGAYDHGRIAIPGTNITIDVGDIVINGEGKTNSDVGREAANQIGKEMERQIQFYRNNTGLTGGGVIT